MKIVLYEKFRKENFVYELKTKKPQSIDVYVYVINPNYTQLNQLNLGGVLINMFVFLSKIYIFEKPLKMNVKHVSHVYICRK